MVEQKPDGEECEMCGALVPGFKHQMCCNGFECGCMGMPIHPCVCSENCWDALMLEFSKRPAEIEHG